MANHFQDEWTTRLTARWRRWSWFRALFAISRYPGFENGGVVRQTSDGGLI